MSLKSSLMLLGAALAPLASAKVCRHPQNPDQSPNDDWWGGGNHGGHGGGGHGGSPDAFDGTCKEIKKPNFILIMTDDQDRHLNSLDYQPAVKKYFADQGTTFEKHYCTISMCCPSRVSFLTGKAAHNTNVTSVRLPFGGYEQFVMNGLNDDYLPVWLQEAGYDTYYAGKLMNGHSTTTYNSPFVNGWTSSDFLIDPGAYLFYNAIMVRDEEEPHQYTGQYSTDLIANKSIAYLDQAIKNDKPFFLGVAPIAPHGETHNRSPDGRPVFNPPVPADRHKDLYPDAKVPRTPHFNPDKPSGASYMLQLDQQNETVVADGDEFYRLRLQTLAAVDELLDGLFDRLDMSPEVLENTYIIYTTDNGFHIGQHRLLPGKTCGIEEDINIPFFIRGPGIAKGVVSQAVTTHTDIVPTIFELAGIPLKANFDGEPIPATEYQQQQLTQKSEHVNVEFWGAQLSEGNFAVGVNYERDPRLLNNTYKSVRLISDDFSLSYTVWCTNQHELYDMNEDPYQLNNLYGTADDIVTYPPVGDDAVVSGESRNRIVSRLNGLLMVLKRCVGRACTRPWDTIHPNGEVKSLSDALDPKYDSFYSCVMPAVSFDSCAPGGQILSNEGPLIPAVYSASFGGFDAWAEWE